MAAAASIMASVIGFGSRTSLMSSGPPAPWNREAPRVLFSDFLKYGKTSSYAQPSLPRAAQPS